uniref:Uncharacterized protein n=1 Tax=Arundo donax TaxID=35708 RepID=A0A0A8ZL87_ARUDO
MCWQCQPVQKGGVPFLCQGVIDFSMFSVLVDPSLLTILWLPLLSNLNF